MVELPDFLKFYQQTAYQVWSQGAITDFEFSGPTYQIQVLDPYNKKKEWTFLQLDDRGGIKDCFCSCMGEDEAPGCIHLAVAYLGVYGHHQEPLHVRFEGSFWNQLCQACAQELGFSSEILTHSGHTYNIKRGNRVWMSMVLLTEASASHMHQLLDSPLAETEETSLKFSNLTQEELSQWRLGQPSLGLSYLLSFWFELAKWLMELQEQEKEYAINFQPDKKLPDTLTIAFKELKIVIHLSESMLSAIIPTLNTVKSPLRVYTLPESSIKEIIFDPLTGKMHIKMQQDKMEGKKKGISFREWTFVPSEGFYALRPIHLFPSNVLEGGQISQALDNQFTIIQSYMKDLIFQETVQSISYDFQFDHDWNFHIQSYLYNPGDLSSPGSWVFGNWVFIKDKGFYRIESGYFPEVEKIIPFEAMNDFISQNRVWLNLQPGFTVHLTGKEPRLGYGLDVDNRLYFFKASEERKGKDRDFGDWVYLLGEGFYPKINPNSLVSIRPGLSISEEQLPLFIHMNQDELQFIPRFFSEICPVEAGGLEIEVTEDQQVSITSHYIYTEGYSPKDVKIFEGFSYVEEEGFHELKGNKLLPDKYRLPYIVDAKHMQDFLGQELDTIRKCAWKIDPKLEPPIFQQLVVLHLSKKEVSGRDWYLVKLAYKTNKGLVDATAIWTALKNNKRFLFTNAGRFDLLNKRYEFLRFYDKKRIDLRSRVISVTPLELIRLQILEEIDLSFLDKSSLSLLQDLLQFKTSDSFNYPELKSQLRPYQQVGVQWLWFLYRHHLSGFVCDDMGLGKTHQAMALMSMVHQNSPNQKQRKHFLVICPTSVLFHWQEKMTEFLPNLNVFVFYGTNRRLADFDEKYDVMLTSYGIWRNEQKFLQKIFFDVAFFDEIQIAKNHTSQIYASLQTVKADMKVGLTGTPIENQLRELKAIFDIIIPTYMPNDTFYRDYFIRPIENQGNVERKYLLSRLVKPFIIRRKKEDVLLDLPEKIEEISHCTLVDEQKHLYHNVLENSRERILQVLNDRTVAVPYMHIFALLSSLKQICNHPAAFLKIPDQYRDFQSGKWELFKELLDEARESSQKIVVFSQYLGMLDIIQHYLEDQKIEYATIRGSTINRSEPVKRFNQDPRCEVFVGSLRATGLGIDLTAGSVVIHYDRWWNAARENQATDRVHRFGQTRGVQVFKLVTLDTIEERIDQLISQKGQLLEDVVGVDEQQFIKQFSRDELIRLFQFMDK